jgi:ferredoxin
MAYVITDNCIKDELCAQACPVDCIHPRSGEDGFEAATQMYVDPAECIDCGACLPPCPSDAIFPLDEVPADKRQFIAVNEAHFAAS